MMPLGVSPPSFTKTRRIFTHLDSATAIRTGKVIGKTLIYVSLKKMVDHQQLKTYIDERLPNQTDELILLMLSAHLLCYVKDDEGNSYYAYSGHLL